jgi:AraC family transcriptional regulator
MDHVVSNSDRRECPARGETPLDVEFSWPGGSLHLRTQPARGHCERRMLRRDLAIGICFQHPGSTVQWSLDGKPVLDKVWNSNGGTLDLIVLPAGHEFVGRCSGSGQGLWLFVDPQSLRPNREIAAFAQRARVDGSWSQDRLSRTIANELKNECHNGFPRGPLFLESASMALLAQLAYLFDKVPPEVGITRSLSKAKLALVLDYIQSNLDRNVTLTELAALVELTPRYFCEVFGRTMGRPPHQFQIEQRVERAKTLLRRPSVPVSEIALMAGFSSQSHLNVCFRRIVGVTPARYRAATIRADLDREIAKTL